MNEWGVAIAESSTTGRIVAPSDKGVYNSRPLYVTFRNLKPSFGYIRPGFPLKNCLAWRLSDATPRAVRCVCCCCCCLLLLLFLLQPFS
jgi:hypothetical protein